MNPLDMLFLLGVYAAVAAGLISLAMGGASVVLVLLADSEKKSERAAKWLKGCVIALVICFGIAVLCTAARILIAVGAA